MVPTKPLTTSVVGGFFYPNFTNGVDSFTRMAIERDSTFNDAHTTSQGSP